MEYIPGEPLGNLLLKEKEQSEKYLETSVKIQRKIHRIQPLPNEVDSMREKLTHQIRFSKSLSDKQKEQTLQRLTSLVNGNSFCHGDFHLFNLIQTDERVVVLDWVDATAGDFRADVCRSYLLYSQVSSEWADLYLQLYCEKSGISKTDVLQWLPIIAAARLSENVATDNQEQLLELVDLY